MTRLRAKIGAFAGSPDRALVFLLFFYLPLAMPGRLVVNHFLGRPWAWYAAFLYPEGLLTVAVCVLAFSSRSGRARMAQAVSDPIWRWMLSSAALLVGWLAVSAAVQRADADFAAERLLAGWILPGALAAALTALDDGTSDAWAGLTAGMAVFVPFALVLYGLSFGVPGSFHELVFGNRTQRMARGLSGGVSFGELTMGGVNDIAIFVAAALAVAAGLWLVARSGGSRAALLGWSVLALLLELLCYSRGAILSLLLLGILLAFTAIRRPRLRRLFVPAGLFLLLMVSALAPGEARRYWADQLRVAEGSTARVRWRLWKTSLTVDEKTPTFGGQLPAPTAEKGAGGPPPAPASEKSAADGGGADPRPRPTANAAEFAREELAKFVARGQRPRWLGFGLGNYGRLQGMTADACTHSMFLDAVVHGGIPAGVLFAAFWGLLVIACLRALASESRPETSGGPPPVSLAGAVFVLTLTGATVSFQFWNLGAMVNGTLVFLLAATTARRARPVRDWKAEAVEQWNAEPCGGASTAPFGTRAYFDAVTAERYERYAPWLVRCAGFAESRGERLLEVGFGLGTDLQSFARGGARAVGVDLTPVHVFATRRRFADAGLPVRLVRGDAERLPFRDGAFDRVYSFGVLHHTPEIGRAVGEIRRVLRPAGRLTLGVYHRASLHWCYQWVVRGILKAGFLRQGYRRTMAAVEKSSAASDAVPLVRAYTASGVRRLLASFGEVRTSVWHFSFEQGGRLGLALGAVLGRFEGPISSRLGWYLMVDARKGGAR